MQIKNQIFNGLLISRYQGDSNDEELSQLTPFLQKLAQLNDVRPVEEMYKAFCEGKDIIALERLGISSNYVPKFSRKMKHGLEMGVLQRDCKEEGLITEGEALSRIPVMTCTPSVYSRKSSTCNTFIETSPIQHYALKGKYNRAIRQRSMDIPFKSQSNQRHNLRSTFANPDFSVESLDFNEYQNEGVQALPISSSLIKKTINS